MRTDPRLLPRGLAKHVAVVVKSGLAGAREIENPALLSGDDEVGLGGTARATAGALPRPTEPGERATGVLRFLSAAVAQRLTVTPSTRLRVANHTLAVNLTAG